MAALYTLKNLNTDQITEINQTVITLGRDAACDLVVESEEASRQHAMLEIRDGQLQLQDLGSTNGTFLNSHKIRSRATVISGDTIGIGGQAILALTPEGEASHTIFGAQLDDDSSYILEKGSPDATSIRMRYPTPPGWTDADSAGLGWSANTAEDRRMTTLLKRSGVNLEATAAALMPTGSKGENCPLILLPNAGENGEWSIGRADDCDVTIEHLTVSGHHASLILQEGVWTVVDRESTNGIKVNGSRRKKSELSDGDRLKVGQVELLFRPLGPSTAE